MEKSREMFYIKENGRIILSGVILGIWEENSPAVRDLIEDWNKNIRENFRAEFEKFRASRPSGEAVGIIPYKFHSRIYEIPVNDILHVLKVESKLFVSAHPSDSIFHSSGFIVDPKSGVILTSDPAFLPEGCGKLPHREKGKPLVFEGGKVVMKTRKEQIFVTVDELSQKYKLFYSRILKFTKKPLTKRTECDKI